MAGKSGWFDSGAFYEALDGTRRSRSVTWKQVAAESGVSASTLTRMAQGRRPDVDGLAALASWSGLRADDFVRTEGDRPEPEALGQDPDVSPFRREPHCRSRHRARRGRQGHLRPPAHP